MNNVSTKLMETRLINYKLPEGWSTTVLDKVGHWSTGGTPSRKVTKYFGGGIPWVKSGDLNDGRVKITEETITREGIESSAAKIVPAGAVIIALYGATIGKLGMLEIDAATNQACANCEVIGEIIDRWFLFYYLLYQRRALIETGQGGAQPNLNNRIIRNWPLLLPPLVEQKRIVAKAEELLERVNATEKRLARVSMIIKRFRQSVLASVCSGHLTADWREKTLHVESAMELLNRVRNERKRRYDEECVKAKVEKRKTPDKKFQIQFWNDEETDKSWVKAKLENLIYIAGRIGWRGLKAEEYTLEGAILLSVYNLNNGEEVDFSNVNHISNERYVESPEIVVKENDILMAKDGAGIGKIGIVINLPSEATVNSSLLVIRSLEAFVPKYLFYFLSGPKLQNIAKERISGSATPHLFQKDIKQFVLSVPPLLEQQEIVRRVEALFKLADIIEKRVAAASLRAEKLTQSILSKSFRGELVTTEAKLARREGRSYETASELLARINSERDAKQTSQKARRNRN